MREHGAAPPSSSKICRPLSGQRAVRSVSADAGCRAVNGVDLHFIRARLWASWVNPEAEKSTLGRAILGLVGIAGGSVTSTGMRVSDGRREDLAQLHRSTAMVFQGSYGSLNPRMTVGAAIAEVLRVHRKVPSGDVGRRSDRTTRHGRLAAGVRRPTAAHAERRPVPARRHRPGSGP